MLLLFLFSGLAIIVWLIAYTILNNSSKAVEELLSSNWSFVIQALLFIAAATIAGWGCNRFIEDLPFDALGWARHRGWKWDFACGSLVGGASMLFATLLAVLGGGLRFEIPSIEVAPLVLSTLLISGAVLSSLRRLRKCSFAVTLYRRCCALGQPGRLLSHPHWPLLTFIWVTRMLHAGGLF
ncbi:MAG: hypothetical protein WKF84_12860 [Pyrinomonadaceae bacterium]